MKKLTLFVILIDSFAATASEVKIPAEIKIRVNRLAKIEAVSETPVKWINLHDDLDLIPDSNGKSAILLGAKVGRFKIAAYTSGKDGPSDPAYCTVIVEGNGGEGSKPPMPNPPPTKGNPEAATAKLRFGNAGCTATIIGPQRSDGKWDVLTAAHCTGNVGATGSVSLKDGRSFKVTVLARNTSADLSWLLADTTDADLPFAYLAANEPSIGTPIWHMGFGIDRPGNKETGTVSAAADANGQLRMKLSVSSGDSGSGIFDTNTGELIAVVCCTDGMARLASVWGGTSVAAARLRKRPTLTHPIHPLNHRDTKTQRKANYAK